MAQIQVLPRHVAELIAAGEVVERPSSVVKELCENAIDAGATSVTVELKRGGVSYLRITDNGCGIPRNQVATAFLRHATSKVQTADDLAAIGTLGFRGEALASVAAMSRTEMLTRTEQEAVGTRYVIEGGEEQSCEDAGCPVGTTIVVRDLFYNTPARMKFLKKDVTEGNAASAVVEKLALSHPEVAFRLIRDGDEKLRTPGDGKLESAVYAVCGRDFAAGLIPVQGGRGGLTIHGLISKPECCRATRGQQSFFINGRFIHSRTAAAALDEAYRNSRMVGKFPGCVLFITAEPHSVDVNVHPAKTEVRFSDEKAIFDLVYYGCKTALQQMGNITQAADRKPSKQNVVNPFTIHNAPISGEQQRMSAQEFRRMVEQEEQPAKKAAPAPKPFTPAPKAQEGLRDSGFVLKKKEKPKPVPQRSAPSDLDLWSGRAVRRAAKQEEPVAAQPQNEIPVVAKPVKVEERIVPEPTVVTEPAPMVEKAQAEEIKSQPKASLSACRMIGELLQTYILLEYAGGLLLVDKHAAHERILFEKLKKDNQNLMRQMLLEPVSVRLSREQYSAAMEHIDVFEPLGFAVEDFGEGMLLIREVPLILPRADAAALVEEIAQNLAENNTAPTPHMLDDLLHSVACRSAVKAGNQSHTVELEAIIEMLDQDPSMRTCPHGRPIAVSMSKRDIEKMFGRID
ncbi:MAG: DNA mismatch repair endonuclease MutL [Oscillospiraceae bacterium]|nr:DNA mismatch repair endonuclease MutL [Oscillospiraceae bacterium]